MVRGGGLKSLKCVPSEFLTRWSFHIYIWVTMTFILTIRQSGPIIGRFFHFSAIACNGLTSDPKSPPDQSGMCLPRDCCRDKSSSRTNGMHQFRLMRILWVKSSHAPDSRGERRSSGRILSSSSLS